MQQLCRSGNRIAPFGAPRSLCFWQRSPDVVTAGATSEGAFDDDSGEQLAAVVEPTLHAQPLVVGVSGAPVGFV